MKRNQIKEPLDGYDEYQGYRALLRHRDQHRFARLNDHPDVSEETREKVLRAVNELHYIPNTSARNLVRTNSDTIALLVKGINNPFFAKIIRRLNARSPCAVHAGAATT